MPNHVDQDLIVTGDPGQLREFMDFAQEGESMLSANKFIPYPEEYRILDEQGAEEHKKGNYSFKDGFNSGGYDWCIKNWGTKWGVYDTIMVKEDWDTNTAILVYNFNSAWSPANKIVVAMSQKFPELTFDLKYYEGGMGYQGQLVVKGGEVVVATDTSYEGPRGG